MENAGLAVAECKRRHRLLRVRVGPCMLVNQCDQPAAVVGAVQLIALATVDVPCRKRQ